MAGDKLSQSEIDGLLSSFKLDFKSELQQLREEIEKLKSENLKLKKEKAQKEDAPDIFKKYAPELEQASKAVKEIIDRIFEENEIEAMAVCVSRARTPNHDGRSVNSSALSSFDKLDEEGFAAACEVFTNPRRIAILKILARDKLTASEIGQRAGLVGGQLYHHLSGLENAGLIKKVGDRYENVTEVCALLIELYATFGFMKISHA